MIFDPRPCELGEGPLWHPLRDQLFWFDITGQRMLSRDDHPQEWRFPRMVSAAGWVSRDVLLVADECSLFLFDLSTGTATPLADLEADNPVTRSNDGRADPQGGFWISTMGKSAQPGAGAIYRWYRGELRCLFPGITIPNAICFPPDGRSAYFTDTVTRQVMRVALDAQGWPVGQPELFLDLAPEGLNPDGAVIDTQGLMWLAEWGAARVAAYTPDGARVRTISFDAPHSSCPAFGGDTLYCTTALQGMDAAARSRYPAAGQTFMAPGVAQGQAEHQVIL
ncbi:MAG: SMP-30/gluconolactonase/LRE family protein [Paracoccus sp. (in: a-proteobacteria)]|uniref:SMP-30/gluconolactonase/LRE family protein n=1 Tax=Paracoccus sp. TaxID=267 RepID=UPI0026E1002B|nr:SMP-30/gluconolactonase/LRE family protein [Paracoccus sp. (in: a-proteobacteria)]MDO5630896.1 SMP-30/gluconolactonase/LRE family protein [Paracoccus sp. (in: a-proteobacteria)]